MKITIDRKVLEHVRAWIAERQEGRTESAGKIVAMLTRELAQPAAQPTGRFAGLREALAQPAAQQEPAGEPVVWARAYMGEIAQTYLEKARAVAEIERLNLQYPKDKSKRELVALYTRPAVPLTDEQRGWIVATCPTPASIISAVEAALIGGAE